MRTQFICGYFLTGALLLWSLISQNFEFLFYGITTLILVALLHKGNQHFTFSSKVLWGFNIWIILHILGGLLPVGDGVLYSLVLIDFIGEPYSILKYDQLVHFYCYFIAGLLIWKIVSSLNQSSFVTASIITVLAASGVGGITGLDSKDRIAHQTLQAQASLGTRAQYRPGSPCPPMQGPGQPRARRA